MPPGFILVGSGDCTELGSDRVDSRLDLQQCAAKCAAASVCSGFMYRQDTGCSMRDAICDNLQPYADNRPGAIFVKGEDKQKRLVVCSYNDYMHH